MTQLKLTVNETETRVCRLLEEKFDFLGYTTRKAEVTCRVWASGDFANGSLQSFAQRIHLLAALRWHIVTAQPETGGTRTPQVVVGRNCLHTHLMGTSHSDHAHACGPKKPAYRASREHHGDALLHLGKSRRGLDHQGSTDPVAPLARVRSACRNSIGFSAKSLAIACPFRAGWLCSLRCCGGRSG